MAIDKQSSAALLEIIIARSKADSTFRQLLLSDPKRAIHEALNVRVPDDFRIRFIEKEPGLDALIVLPDLREAEELYEADLDAVAGGAADPSVGDELSIELPGGTGLWAAPPTSL